ncbi:MAG: TIGR03960 family B12-binding radical SAM protein [Proteobacteria bacterium]|nr:TIGR03960 family B12-binding radical SAM protein [Pseudomonadota bacterium]
MKMKQNMLGCLNKSIEKPLRYIGGERNSILKENTPARILLAFPDIYEIGMSHFGSRILYETVNYKSPYSMERVYMPWKDMYYEMKKNGTTLVSLESQSNFSDFDAVGFSLQHELSFTNVLAMLELGGIELISDKRGENVPIIIAGGGAVYNPAPMKRFVDAFMVGEADQAILEIMEILGNTKNKKERLKALAKIDGVYVPSVHEKNHTVIKRMLASLDDSPLITKPLVPFLELIHDRITYEIQRGCNRGCRFCQAGMIYRPVRQRNPESIINAVEKDIEQTGYRDIGFLSLNACDYPPMLELVDWIYKRFRDRGLYVSLPSLRIESISDNFLNILSKLPKSGFTIAPEAGSERLRKIINKDITEEETLNTINVVSKLGWENIKSYFMIGLPKETDADIEAIAELVRKMQSKLHGGRNRLTISISNFVPKSHTPFQWEAQLNWEEFERKLSVLTHTLRDRRLSLKWCDPKMSEIEGVLARGDERIGELILIAYKKGEIFTGWGSEFHYKSWLEAMNELKIDKHEYLGQKDISGKLPWNNISSGVDEKWLKEERGKAYIGEGTKSCIADVCSDCGVCKNLNIENSLRTSFPHGIDEEIKHQKTITDRSGKKTILRAVFGKKGKFRWIGHFELMNAVEKAALRANLPVTVSQGFKPVLLLSYSPPVGAGIKSLVELVDVCFFENIDEKDFIDRINEHLPDELRFKSAWKIYAETKSLNQSIRGFDWSADVILDDDVAEKIKGMPVSMDGKSIEIERKGKKKTISLSEYVKGINFSIDKDTAIINFSTCFIDGRTVKPSEVLKVLLPAVEESKMSLTRKGVNIDGIDINY